MIRSGLNFKGKPIIQCYDSNNNLKWEEGVDNTVVDEGINHILDVVFDETTSQVSTWYIGLLGSTPNVSATDTLSDLNEETNYDGDRKEFIHSRTDQQVDNRNDKATFSITGTATIGGAFMASAASGTTGILLCGAAFDNGDKPVDNGDTLNVRYDFSGSSA